jgi:hypothetical protein
MLGDSWEVAGAGHRSHGFTDRRRERDRDGARVHGMGSRAGEVVEARASELVLELAMAEE